MRIMFRIDSNLNIWGFTMAYFPLWNQISPGFTDIPLVLRVIKGSYNFPGGSDSSDFSQKVRAWQFFFSVEQDGIRFFGAVLGGCNLYVSENIGVSLQEYQSLNFTLGGRAKILQEHNFLPSWVGLLSQQAKKRLGNFWATEFLQYDHAHLHFSVFYRLKKDFSGDRRL